MKKLRRGATLAARVAALERLHRRLARTLLRHLRAEPVRFSVAEIKQLCDEALGALRRGACAPTRARERN